MAASIKYGIPSDEATTITGYGIPGMHYLYASKKET